MDKFETFLKKFDLNLQFTFKWTYRDNLWANLHVRKIFYLTWILVFTSQPYMFIDIGRHLSLHPNSHHQIQFMKLSLQVYYLPLYEKHVWHYKHANTAQIKKCFRFSAENRHLQQLPMLCVTIFAINQRYLMTIICLEKMWKSWI